MPSAAQSLQPLLPAAYYAPFFISDDFSQFLLCLMALNGLLR